MSVTKYFIKDVSRRLEIDELLQRDLKRAGYSKVELTKSPVGTRVVIYAAKPGMVIGRRGQSIKDLQQWYVANGFVQNPVALDEFFDTSYLDYGLSVVGRR